MIKKITITSLATLSLLLISAQAEGNMKCSHGGKTMMKQAKQGNKMNKKKKNSPFLIRHGLPHMTRVIMKNWDDPKLALTQEQKDKLLIVRKDTMSGVMKLKNEVTTLRKEIVQASRAGVEAGKLKEKVDKLASLEANATMVHLECLDNTKAILSTEQYTYLIEKRKQHRAAKREAVKVMKCAAGKCGGKK